MKHLLSVLILILVTASFSTPDFGVNLTASLASAGDEGTPSMEVPERSYHLGKISLDRQYEHGFRVFNTGTGILQIEKVTVG